MSKEIYISSTPHETRLAIVENDALTEIYYERENEYTLAGSIYNGKVTRVLPGMQSSFVDIGLDRDAFLYITDFMEEAGDSAEFNEGGGHGGERRPAAARPENGEAPRGREGRGDRGDRGGRDTRGGRGDRGGQGSVEGATQRSGRQSDGEPSDAELFTQAVAGMEPGRNSGQHGGQSGFQNGGQQSAEGERGGSRRGGRGRRDRGGNSDGAARRDRNADRPEARPVEANGNVQEPVEEFKILAEPTPAEDSAELGAGAPGADGSRRWRGRRGRRGTRGDAPRETGQTPQDSSSAEEMPEAAAFTAPEVEVREAPQAAQETSERGRGDREDRGGRDGNRDGNRDGGRDGGRGRGGRSQSPRVPRGFAPSTSLYQVDGAAEQSNEVAEEAPSRGPIYGAYGREDDAPAGEPMILPGESLSKYRAGGAESAPTPVATSAQATPTPEFTVAGWDGGAVLPGETLRARTPSAGDGGQEARGGGRREERGGRNDRGGSDRGGSDRGGRNSGRDGGRGRGGRRDERPARTEFRAPMAAEAAAIPVASEEPVHQMNAAAEMPVVAEQHEEKRLDTHADAHTEMHAETQVNSTFVPPPPMPEHVEERVEERVEAKHDEEYEPTEASASYRVDPVPPSEYRQSAPVAEVEAAPVMEHEAHEAPMQEQAMPEHDLTSISASGEMFSEPTAMTTQKATAPSETLPEPLADMPAEIAAGDQTMPYFAPGSGVLEEEEMLDDEDDAQPQHEHALEQVHASADRDAHEQVMIDGGADLGSMLREMSIDQITRTEPTLDEDDEEDEDFLEEDQDSDGEGYAENEDGEDFGDEHGEDHEPSGETATMLEDSGYGSAAGTAVASEGNGQTQQEPRRDDAGRRDGRRDGRRSDRSRRSSGGDRDRGSDRSSSSSDRSGSDRGGSDRSSSSSSDRGRRDGGRGRQTMQATNLPAISDLLKPGQEVLVQIAKEPIAKKGARITSHIALPGRFLVFMPTVQHTGVSRKIESDTERRRLKEILLSERGEASGGFIVRTAAANASEEELRSDLRFLLNLWSDIKARSEGSKSPALIYHDLNLVERVLRDQVTDTFSAIWVDTESEYERVLRFLQRFQPSLIRRVKLYTKETPLFEQFGITEEINKALRSKVWLKSGGSIVINQTEALVAIDINTGKFVGKTARLEDTIVKTNLDAIPEIVRQIRLRDLGGIIIIDFIDMDERKNRNRVMAALEEELKSDRAPSKVLQFNDFGLVAITRKRVKQSLERTLSTTCGICQGTGMTKSPVSVCNDIYIELRKMHKHMDRGDIMLRVHPDVVKQLKSATSRWLQEMEEMAGKTILVKSDPSLHPEQFDLH